jgi:hypothetical protein
MADDGHHEPSPDGDGHGSLPAHALQALPALRARSAALVAHSVALMGHSADLRATSAQFDAQSTVARLRLAHAHQVSARVKTRAARDSPSSPAEPTG